MPELSFTKNQFVPQNYWIVSLSNGQTIFEDNKPNLPTAWRRLYEYIKLNNIYITCLRLVLNGTTITFPTDSDGYYYTKGESRTIGDKQLIIFKGVGYIKKNRAIIVFIREDGYVYLQERENLVEPFAIFTKKC